ncbi:MAG: hypothetical protein FJW27_09400 [Acidimicrobiia bacterium]|nr:hypothetical protein [Acidimicrobiia bacterium]
MSDVAELYVRMVLAVGQHDADYVDAYYGPAEWKTEVAALGKRPLAELLADTRRLVGLVPEPALVGERDPLVELRHDYLRRQLKAVEARLRMLRGETFTFDEESRALYDAQASEHPASHYEQTLRELDPLLPGDGTLIERYDRFRRDFVVPADRLSGVFARAIEECRRRTLEHVTLPEGESFRVEYVTNKSWSGYNWYQGNFHSLIQVNTDLPIYVDRAVDLACHEGYPGHHVYNALLEQHLVRARGWVEFSIYPLFSPQSLIAEGTANYGIEVAFPGDGRTRFERDVIFPLAGLDASRAEQYQRVQALVDRLVYAGNEAARAYLNGRMSRADAVGWLTRYALMSPHRAEQRTRFFDQYRSYVINYNLGKDLVKAYIESRAGGSAAARWTAFAELLSSPRLPSGLQPSAR